MYCHILRVRAIPTYRVYRLYENSLIFGALIGMSVGASPPPVGSMTASVHVTLAKSTVTV